MMYERQMDLIERKRRLGWTNREIANILNIPPNTVSCKLSGFISLSDTERHKLESAMDEAEQLGGLDDNK
jgi:DNA-binding NarL/FixJ family response regulator